MEQICVAAKQEVRRVGGSLVRMHSNIFCYILIDALINTIHGDSINTQTVFSEHFVFICARACLSSKYFYLEYSSPSCCLFSFFHSKLPLLHTCISNAFSGSLILLSCLFHFAISYNAWKMWMTSLYTRDQTNECFCVRARVCECVCVCVVWHERDLIKWTQW